MARFKTPPKCFSFPGHLKTPREGGFWPPFSSLGTQGNPGLGCQETKIIGDSLDFGIGGKIQVPHEPFPKGDCLVPRSLSANHTSLERLGFTCQYQDDEDWQDVESVVTIDLQAQGTETDFKLTHAGLPTPESRDNHEYGWTQSVDKLALYLAA